LRLLVLFFASVAACAASLIGSLVVEATADIYSAGHSSLPATIDPGTFAPSFSFLASPDQVLTFSSVTGMVGCNFAITNGPDGTCIPGVSTTVTSDGGLSGISANDANFFLVGVFLDSTEPSDPPPATLLYNYGTPGGLTTEDETYLPDLDQVFFIGDGLTGTGTGDVQQFDVPAEATGLYLGFADSFDSVPSYYADNLGSLEADFQISTVPEPRTLFPSGIGLILTGLLFRWRHAEKHAGGRASRVP
jgi:hypothetical protein